MVTASAVPMPKKRGRPRKHALPETQQQKQETQLTDEQVITLVIQRFNVLRKMAKGIVERKVRSLIASGAPGIGKTYTIEKILEHSAETSQGTATPMRYKITRGYMTAVNLFRLLYEYRHEGDVLVIDDCDAVFYDDTALNILKAALDTIEHRVISWLSDNPTISRDKKEEDDSIFDGDVPNEFEYKGSMVFITNIDFVAYLQAGKTRVTPHLDALMNRAFYLDLKLHGERAVSLWIDYMCRKAKMLQTYGMSDEQSEAILKYLLANKSSIPRMSLRSAVKCSELVKMDEDGWQGMADVLLRA